ncbi:hypothetical protein K470DRAFT_254418 [Piedraia hortae CBS 480.64]|uniref:Protein-lysine N-methyltransferase EFM6 n=1 Tax=Piedraia hortae CBS 480.64 TaxID=1314780 RepID=A0A6A7CC69_9PEZI|nr:hypothetical protein K470DRAFT_254418 [Piedraia hortae CBS 480.64]
MDSFTVSEDLVTSPSHKQAGTSHTDFDGLLAAKRQLKLHEDLAQGNGGQAWPAGHVLAKYLLRTCRETLRDCSIVELGAGGGLVGLSVALGCKLRQPIYITDQAPMLPLMQKNIELNGLQDHVKAIIYNWGDSRPDNIPSHPDVVLAADCVYFEPAFPLLCKTLEDLIGPETTCYFCFKKRRRADMQFVKAVRKAFEVEPVLDDPDQKTYARENITLCTIKRKHL